MKKQELMNAIAVLSGTIDTLVRAGEKEAIKTVVKKVLTLVEKL